MGQGQADLGVDVHDESRAIEAGGTRASPGIRCAEVTPRGARDPLARGRDGLGLIALVGTWCRGGFDIWLARASGRPRLVGGGPPIQGPSAPPRSEATVSSPTRAPKWRPWKISAGTAAKTEVRP